MIKQNFRSFAISFAAAGVYESKKKRIKFLSKYTITNNYNSDFIHSIYQKVIEYKSILAALNQSLENGINIDIIFIDGSISYPNKMNFNFNETKFDNELKLAIDEYKKIANELFSMIRRLKIGLIAVIKQPTSNKYLLAQKKY